MEIKVCNDNRKHNESYGEFLKVQQIAS